MLYLWICAEKLWIEVCSNINFIFVVRRKSIWLWRKIIISESKHIEEKRKIILEM